MSFLTPSPPPCRRPRQWCGPSGRGGRWMAVVSSPPLFRCHLITVVVTALGRRHPRRRRRVLILIVILIVLVAVLVFVVLATMVVWANRSWPWSSLMGGDNGRIVIVVAVARCIRHRPRQSRRPWYNGGVGRQVVVSSGGAST